MRAAPNVVTIKLLAESLAKALAKSFAKSLAILAATGAASVCSLAMSGTDLLVSQKGRRFNPVSVTLDKGGALVIVNDDADLLHHAYVESETFSFDSGDQKPGSHTRIVFPVAGDFKVLCGIHPKMKLAVHVQ